MRSGTARDGNIRSAPRFSGTYVRWTARPIEHPFSLVAEHPFSLVAEHVFSLVIEHPFPHGTTTRTLVRPAMGTLVLVHLTGTLVPIRLQPSYTALCGVLACVGYNGIQTGSNSLLRRFGIVSSYMYVQPACIRLRPRAHTRIGTYANACSRLYIAGNY